MPDAALLVTCEHAVNQVPPPWRTLFKGCPEILTSHRAYDAGALGLARALADACSAPCLVARISRLLIDHNRSPHNRALWSEFSRGLPGAQKSLLRNDYYEAFREEAARWIAVRHTLGQPVLHLSVHTFTPVLDGRVRDVDIGVLYDPRRPAEKGFGRAWRNRLAEALPELRIRLNQPYPGRSDSHLTTYRRQYADAAYRGIELEVNQALLAGNLPQQALHARCADTLRETMASWP